MTVLDVLFLLAILAVAVTLALGIRSLDAPAPGPHRLPPG